MDNLLLEVSNLSKSIKNKKIIDDVSLNLKRGEIVGLLGLNGSGKSSIIKIILGLMQGDQGKILYFGKDFNRYPEASLLRVGCMFENFGFYEDMTVMENLQLVTNIVGLHKPYYLEELLNTFQLTDFKKIKVKTLDFSAKKKLDLVRALLNYPSILILDEPFRGLDIKTSKHMSEVLLRFVREKNIGILISSHLLKEIEKIADRVIILHKGKIIESLHKNALQGYDQYYTLIRVKEVKKTLDLLKAHGFSVKLKNNSLIVPSKEVNPLDIFKIIIDNKLEIYEIYPQVFTLEDHFIKITRDEVKL